MKKFRIHIISWSILIIVCFIWYGYWNWWTGKYFLKALDELANYFLLMMFVSFWFFVYAMLVMNHEETD